MAYCVAVKMPDGGVALVRIGGKRPSCACSRCGRPATIQCDYPTGPGKTCDAWLCRTCAIPVGPDRDYCRYHPRGDDLPPAA
jgi:hypothetical protein